MRYTDRSRRVMDQTCPRCCYYSYHYKGRGLSPKVDADPLLFGGEMARQVERIKKGEAWGVEGFEAWEKVGKEDVVDLATGLLTGYEDVVWPRWMKHHTPVEVEAESPLILNPSLTYNSRADTLLEGEDGSLTYLEDKTTKWMPSLLTYSKNVQVHATALCIETQLPNQRRVDKCIVQGMYKGFVKEGNFYHPLVWAYRKEGRVGIVPDQWTPKWKSGWERSRVATYPGGVRAFIKTLDDNALGEVFGNSEPVMINRELAMAYLVQAEIREGEIAEWHQEGRPLDRLDRVFPQHFDQCEEFGKSRGPCRNHGLCHEPTIQRFPMEIYKWREPHHENELAAFREEFGE